MVAFPSTLANRIQWDSATRTRFNVAQLRNNGGYVKRVSRWASALHAWPLDIGEMTDTEWQELRTFYESVGGPANEFTISEPITGISRTVHFADDTLEISWRMFEVADADIVLEELRS